MRVTLLGFACLIVCSLPGCGQTLHVSPVEGAPGQSVAVEISLDSPKGKAPATLQWVTVFPAQLLEMESRGPEAGRAAKDSGKTVTCAERKPYSHVCILTGGKGPIANGPIATFHFKIRTNAPPGTSAVRIEGAQGVTLNLQTVSLKDDKGTVTIH